MRHLVSGVLAAVTIFSGSAFAADMPVKASPVPVYTWSGWYVGANLGYGFNKNGTDFFGRDAGGAARVAAGILPASVSENRNGPLGGFQFGLNQQTGNIVYGIEADIAYASIKGSATSVFPIAPASVNTSTDSKLDWLGTVRGRLGLAAFDRSLFYVTGGLAYGQARSSVDVTTVNNGACTLLANLCGSSSTQKWMAGWTAGAGWEWAFAPKWSAKAEYLYYDLGKIENTIVPVNGAAGITFGSSTRFNGNIVRLGVNYKL